MLKTMRQTACISFFVVEKYSHVNMKDINKRCKTTVTFEKNDFKSFLAYYACTKTQETDLTFVKLLLRLQKNINGYGTGSLQYFSYRMSSLKLKLMEQIISSDFAPQ